MRQPLSILDQIDLAGKLGDLKEQHYNHTLLLTALLELLTEKGLLTAEEIRTKAAGLHQLALSGSEEDILS
ncbi:hypothetical protein [Paenibacillus sp. YN15]|uniref:hypothetical protein n=1 Tax=Paenibacillus sp. YN15 TaxID=1742774 RepID=UPI000DCB3C43|nr:hypothetical protein [Paenibacillus sp. YN15]RAV00159.1 hypothetical protein DQG13_14485 [Paenibacillus sp. YN15]